MSAPDMTEGNPEESPTITLERAYASGCDSGHSRVHEPGAGAGAQSRSSRLVSVGRRGGSSGGPGGDRVFALSRQGACSTIW